MATLEDLAIKYEPSVSAIFFEIVADRSLARELADEVLYEITPRFLLDKKVKIRLFLQAVNSQTYSYIKDILTSAAEAEGEAHGGLKAILIQFDPLGVAFLSSRQRLAYRMRQDGFEAPEIAGELGCSAGAARALVSRACKQLGIPNSPPMCDQIIRLRRTQ